MRPTSTTTITVGMDPALHAALAISAALALTLIIISAPVQRADALEPSDASYYSSSPAQVMQASAPANDAYALTNQILINADDAQQQVANVLPTGSVGPVDTGSEQDSLQGGFATVLGYLAAHIQNAYVITAAVSSSELETLSAVASELSDPSHELAQAAGAFSDFRAHYVSLRLEELAPRTYADDSQ